MRITRNMLNRYTNSVNPLAYSRKTSHVKSTAGTKLPTTSGISRNRQISNTTAVDKYIKLGENAESLRSSAYTLGRAGKNNIFENARNTGSKDAVFSQAKQMVSGYNSTMSGMKDDNSSLNRVYRQLMENAATENSESLANVGILVNGDKTLTIDEAKFKNSSIDEIEAAIGSSSSFTSRVGSMAENISKNAVSTATNLNRAYNPYGIYNPYGTYKPYGTYNPYGSSNYLSALLSGSNRFNLWG